MKHLKPYNESTRNDDEIKYIIKDALVDLVQAGMGVYIDRGKTVIGDFRKDIIKVVINRESKDNLFSFNDIEDPINTLISIMASEGYELESAKYYMNLSRPGFAKTLKWFNISMDPIEGEVNGDEIIKFKHIDSDNKEISTFSIEFHNHESIKSYESFSSDSDLWYSNQHKPDYNLEEYEDIIKDRLVELDDNGLNVKVKYNYNSISIRIEKPQKRFLVKEALEDVISLISHMSDEWDLEVSIKFDPNNSYNKINKIMKLNYVYDGEGYVDQLRYLSTNYVNGIELNFYQRKNTKTNESISISELSDDINDICLDITDDGYIVSDNLYLCDDPLPEPLTNRKPWIQISSPDNLLFDPKEVIDVIIRINEYLKTKGFYIKDVSDIGRHRTTTMGYGRYIYNITTQSSIGTKKITLWIDDIKTNESMTI